MKSTYVNLSFMTFRQLKLAISNPRDAKHLLFPQNTIQVQYTLNQPTTFAAIIISRKESLIWTFYILGCSPLLLGREKFIC